jgi:glucosamine kinase
LLAGRAPADAVLTDRLLDRWGCASVADLRWAVREEDRFTNTSSENPFSDAAAVVAGAACDGDELARSVCEAAVADVVTGVRLVGGSLDAPVAVASAGSVLGSEFVGAEFRRRLASLEEYRYVEAAMRPVLGAVFDAIDRTTGVDDAVAARLAETPVERD